MSETPESDRIFGTTPSGTVYGDGFARHLETERNRWRSVAEQAEKALKTIRSHSGEIRLLNWNRRSAPVADGIACEIIDEVNHALAAFDSLRKEGK